jgi:hypothetical protein
MVARMAIDVQPGRPHQKRSNMSFLRGARFPGDKEKAPRMRRLGKMKYRAPEGAR